MGDWEPDLSVENKTGVDLVGSDGGTEDENMFGVLSKCDIVVATTPAFELP
jgi:hypothetical protein